MGGDVFVEFKLGDNICPRIAAPQASGGNNHRLKVAQTFLSASDVENRQECLFYPGGGPASNGAVFSLGEGAICRME
jgi:hypothetical protein